MKSILAMCLCLGFSFTASALTYHYNPKSGRCVNAKGKVGLNHISETNLMLPADFVDQGEDGTIFGATFSNRSAECTDLTNVDVDALLRKPEYGTSYLTLENLNLDGAVLTGGKLAWSVGNVSVRGADLTGLQGGYVMMTVTYDRFTDGLVRCLITSKKSKTCEWRF